MPRLIRPDARAHVSFLAAMREFVEEGRAGGPTMVGSDIEEYAERWQTRDGFAEYVADTLAREHTPKRDGFVTDTSLWWVEGSEEGPEYLGRIAIRHELTAFLREVGGHIGYDVRRSRRREGHATAMLAAAMPVAAAHGIDPALITCDATNVGSRRVIEANDGVLEDERDGKLRFWVPTGSRASGLG